MPQRLSGQLPKPLLRFVVVLLALAAASVLDALIGYRHEGRSALRYLWVPYPGFDFYDYTPRFPFLHTPGFFHANAFPWVYPAPALFLLYPFYLFAQPTHWVPSFLAFGLIAALVDLALARQFQKALMERGLAFRPALLLIAAVMLFGWPFYFALQRGNIESLLWAGLAAGFVCFATSRYAGAALLLGIFGSVKLYPLLFLALFLNPRRLRFFALGLGAASLTTLAGLRCLEPDIRDAYIQIRDGVRSWTEITTLAYGPVGVGPDHSLMGLLREATGGAILRPAHALDLYLITAGVLTSILFLSRVQQLPASNKTLFLCCAAILLPPTSYDYTLLLALIPWAWIVLVCIDQARAGQDLRPFTLPLLLFAVALAPLTFLHTRGAVQLYFEGPVRCLALLGLLARAAWKPLPESIRDLPIGQAAASALT